MIRNKVSILGLLIFLIALGAFGASVFTGLQEAAAQQSGGTIKGTVKSPWVSRYQAVVFIDHVNGQFPPTAGTVHISQKGLQFQPHIQPVLKGTTVDFTNDDTVAHNVSSPPGSATVFNLGIYGPGVTKTETFSNPGVVTLLCSVHPEMLGYILVLQNPYYAMVDKSGNFEIKNVPPGSYTLKVWDEKLKEASQSVTVEAGKTVNVEFTNLKKG